MVTLSPENLAYLATKRTPKGFCAAVMQLCQRKSHFRRTALAARDALGKPWSDRVIVHWIEPARNAPGDNVELPIKTWHHEQPAEYVGDINEHLEELRPHYDNILVGPDLGELVMLMDIPRQNRVPLFMAARDEMGFSWKESTVYHYTRPGHFNERIKFRLIERAAGVPIPQNLLEEIADARTIEAIAVAIGKVDMEAEAAEAFMAKLIESFGYHRKRLSA